MNDITILPPDLAYRQFGMKAPEAMREAAKSCVIVTIEPTVYRINMARAEVVYRMRISGPSKLINCVVFDSKNWVCEYPDFSTGVYKDKPYSGKISFVDGFQAIYEAEATGPYYGRHFAMRGWQWWIARLLGMFGWSGKSQWLIPEQTYAF